MKLPVLVEPIPGKGFVAKTASPFDWSAEGATADEAMANLRVEVARHMQSGARAAMIDVPHVTPQLWLSGVGTIPDDEVTQIWLDAIAENRRKMDADPKIL